MKLISIRDLRSQSTQVWKAAASEEVVVTSNGRPIGILIGLDPDEDLEQALAAVRRARALKALGEIWEASRTAGTDRLIPADIQAEILAARRARRTPAKRKRRSATSA